MENGNKGTKGGRDREAEWERINTTGADIVTLICYNDYRQIKTKYIKCVILNVSVS